VKSFCSDECKAAGRSVNEKYKPEAGRACTPGCGDVEYEVGWCSDACRRAGRSLNPAPRPVETFAPLPDDEFRRAMMDGEEAGRRSMRRQALDEGRAPPIESPRPVERCSCPESVALRKALEDIVKKCSGVEFGRMAQIERIARRALALGGETK